MGQWCIWRYFNSHPHEEDDSFLLHLTLFVPLFQLTSSRRGWPTYGIFATVTCDISTHILTKRMTKFDEYYNEVRKISTHILTKRMTIEQEVTWSCLTFQLTSSRRGWQEYIMELFYVTIFQLTSSRRGWRSSTRNVTTVLIFQLTSSRRGWPFA